MHEDDQFVSHDDDLKGGGGGGSRSGGGVQGGALLLPDESLLQEEQDDVERAGEGWRGAVDGAGGDEEGEEERQTGEREKEAAVDDFQEARRMVKEASTVVGMHADQATEAIVKYAIENGKALAVVPCCVYSSEPQFRTRVNADGSRVKTYEQLVNYYKRQYGLLVETLPFEGKNKVLYSLGPAISK